MTAVVQPPSMAACQRFELCLDYVEAIRSLCAPYVSDGDERATQDAIMAIDRLAAEMRTQMRDFIEPYFNGESSVEVEEEEVTA